MNFRHLGLAMIILIALPLTLTACGGAPAMAAQTLTVRARDIAFDVTTLNAKAGQPIEVTYVNEGLLEHAFAIEGLIKQQTTKPGQTRTFTFTPTTTGSFKYYCALAGHEPAGMVGTLIVTQ
jgi:plastocyanin